MKPVRNRWLRIALIALGLIAALIFLVASVGWMLPARHIAGGEAVYAVPRDSLFAVLTDVGRFPEWRSGMQRVERRPSAEGKERWLEVSGDGEILYEVQESVAGRRLVTRIADPDLPFGGTWTYELHDTPGGTQLRITEAGGVYNPIFRFALRFVFGYQVTIDRFLKDLAARVSA